MLWHVRGLSQGAGHALGAAKHRRMESAYDQRFRVQLNQTYGITMFVGMWGPYGYVVIKLHG